MDIENRIFLSTGAKLAAIVQDVQSVLGQAHSVVVTTHFRESFTEIQGALASAGLNPFVCQTPFDQEGLARALSGETPALALAMADLLDAASLQAVSVGSLPPRAFLVGESHPTQAGDDAILRSARSHPATSMVRFYDSLDGALFMRYGGKQVQAMWTMLFLREDQYLSHPIIAHTIRQAQKKIARQVASPLAAHSVEGWFQQNVL